MKTAKEEAKIIFDKFYLICQEYIEEPQCSIQVKKIAIMEVDENILQNGELYLIYQNNLLIKEHYYTKNKFLFEVKKELEKL